MSKSSIGSIAVAAVALLLTESVKYEKQNLEAGKVYEFDATTAERLLAKGAAIVPPAAPELGATTRVVEKVVEREVEKIVEREVVVNALSRAGVAFQRLKTTKAAAEFVLEQTSAAIVAELQALEYRRAGGVRPDVAEAFGAAWAALSPAGE
jgi:hypothetical protein